MTRQELWQYTKKALLGGYSNKTVTNNAKTMRKILTSIFSELKLIFVPTIQFLLGSWLMIVLVVSISDNTFQQQWSVCIFLISWILCLLSFCGMFWHYRKHVAFYRVTSSFAFIVMNSFLLFVIERYSV